MKISEIRKFQRGENVSVGEQIKGYIREAGISQKWLVEKTMIPAPKLNMALNGKRRLTFDEYASICWALGVNTDRFITPKAPNRQEEQDACG